MSPISPTRTPTCRSPWPSEAKRASDHRGDGAHPPAASVLDAHLLSRPVDGCRMGPRTPDSADARQIVHPVTERADGSAGRGRPRRLLADRVRWRTLSWADVRPSTHRVGSDRRSRRPLTEAGDGRGAGRDGGSPAVGRPGGDRGVRRDGGRAGRSDHDGDAGVVPAFTVGKAWAREAGATAADDPRAR